MATRSLATVISMLAAMNFYKFLVGHNFVESQIEKLQELLNPCCIQRVVLQITAALLVTNEYDKKYFLLSNSFLDESLI